MTEKVQSFERHRLVPESDGGVRYFRNPIFTRRDFYEMILAAKFLYPPAERTKV